MAYIGTYYFNRLGKELLRCNYSIRAALAKRGVTKASSSSVAFSASSTTPTPCLPLFSSKQRYKALPKRGRVKINLYSSNKDLPRANKVIITKVPHFSTTRIYSSSLTGFGSSTTKKSYTISFNPITPTKPSKLTSTLQRDILALIPSYPQGLALTFPTRVLSIWLNGISNLLEWNLEYLQEALATIGLISILQSLLILISLFQV